MIEYVKNHVAQFTALGAFLTMFGGTVAGWWNSYKSFEQLPRLLGRVDTLEHALHITNVALSHEMEKSGAVYKTNAGDYWVLIEKNGRLYLFAAHYNKQNKKFYYIDFDNKHYFIK